MLAASAFRRSRLSWFRCPYCDAATFAASSRIILIKSGTKLLVEYRCQHCGKVSKLRRPGLMNLVLPLSVAACAFVIVYHILAGATPWYSPWALAVVALVLGFSLMIDLANSRVGKQFEKT